MNIGGVYEGFGILREGRQTSKRKRPNLTTLPTEIQKRQQADRIANLWHQVPDAIQPPSATPTKTSQPNTLGAADTSAPPEMEEELVIPEATMPEPAPASSTPLKTSNFNK